jgi:hypothetical protein
MNLSKAPYAVSSEPLLHILLVRVAVDAPAFENVPGSFTSVLYVDSVIALDTLSQVSG